MPVCTVDLRYLLCCNLLKSWAENGLTVKKDLYEDILTDKLDFRRGLYQQDCVCAWCGATSLCGTNRFHILVWRVMPVSICTTTCCSANVTQRCEQPDLGTVCVCVERWKTSPPEIHTSSLSFMLNHIYMYMNKELAWTEQNTFCLYLCCILTIEFMGNLWVCFLMCFLSVQTLCSSCSWVCVSMSADLGGVSSRAPLCTFTEHTLKWISWLWWKN